MGHLGKTVAKLLLIFMTLIGGQIIFGTPVFGVTASSISISATTLSPVSLMPESFTTTAQTITVTTDNYTGYTLSMTTSGSSSGLVNVSDNTLVIPTITLPSGSSSIPSSSFDNEYGWSLDATNYYPVVAPNNSVTLNTTNTASTSGSSTNLTFGMEVDGSTPAGTYQNTFVITAVVNNPQYSIDYDANTNDTVSNMPADIATTISATGTVDISSTTPTRSGYTFLGWDENSTVTSNPTYSAGDTITLEPTQANVITLYAIWESSGGGGSGTPEDPYIDDTTTTYDPDNQEPGTTVTYTAVTGSPTVTVDENGDVTAFEFTDLGTTGTDVTGFDTGLVAFDGSSSFTLHIKFTETLSNDTSYDKVVSVIQDTGTGSSHNYSGFTLFYYYKSSGGGGGSGNAKYLRTQSFTNKSSLQGSTMSSGNNLYKVDTTVTSYYNANTTYEFDIVYNQSNRQVSVTSSINGGTASTQTFTSNITTALTNATVVIGSNGLDSTENMSSTFLVSEFSVTKN